MDTQKKSYIKIREYIDTLFKDAPKTMAAIEMKEEMISNAEEKMTDLLAEGYREDDAFSVVIHSIGNVEELFADLEIIDSKKTAAMTEEYYKKKAFITTIAVGLYIFAGAIFLGAPLIDDMIPTNTFDFSSIGFILAILICIVPTCMLTYIAILSPAYKKKQDNIVEEYKEWKSGNERDRSIRKAIESILWTLTVFIYLAISFLTFRWDITWIVFIIALCLDSIVKLVFSLKRN